MMLRYTYIISIVPICQGEAFLIRQRKQYNKLIKKPSRRSFPHFSREKWGRRHVSEKRE